tara:strand:- start:53 stop:259 length:207 start_codon:yes stop_codon:yes gene_type:complete
MIKIFLYLFSVTIFFIVLLNFIDSKLEFEMFNDNVHDDNINTINNIIERMNVGEEDVNKISMLDSFKL